MAFAGTLFGIDAFLHRFHVKIPVKQVFLTVFLQGDLIHERDRQGGGHLLPGPSPGFRGMQLHQQLQSQSITATCFATAASGSNYTAAKPQGLKAPATTLTPLPFGQQLRQHRKLLLQVIRTDLLRSPLVQQHRQHRRGTSSSSRAEPCPCGALGSSIELQQVILD